MPGAVTEAVDKAASKATLRSGASQFWDDNMTTAPFPTPGAAEPATEGKADALPSTRGPDVAARAELE